MKKGFTLIELLVVVLIIGILSAIALPQYRFSVEKARASEAMIVLRQIEQLQALYRLENGKYASTIEELGPDVPGTIVAIGHNRSQTTYYVYDIGSAAYNSIAMANRVPFNSDYYFILKPNDSRIWCHMISSFGRTFCEKLSKQDPNVQLLNP